MTPTRALAARLLLALLGAGCASTAPYDYGPLLDHMPASILVLPPLNESPEAEVSPVFLSTITRPLGERGYYVFPVALVERIMRENGLPTAYEMHSVSLGKLDEVFGPDAVLYITVRDWGTSYEVISSNTRVTIAARLVDVDSGQQIWAGSATAVRSSNDGQGGLLDALVGAVVNQVVATALDPTPQVAREASRLLVENTRNGLLEGPFHPRHEERVRQERAERSARSGAAP